MTALPTQTRLDSLIANDPDEAELRAIGDAMGFPPSTYRPPVETNLAETALAGGLNFAATVIERSLRFPDRAATMLEDFGNSFVKNRPGTISPIAKASGWFRQSSVNNWLLQAADRGTGDFRESLRVSDEAIQEPWSLQGIAFRAPAVAGSLAELAPGMVMPPLMAIPVADAVVSRYTEAKADTGDEDAALGAAMVEALKQYGFLKIGAVMGRATHIQFGRLLADRNIPAAARLIGVSAGGTGALVTNDQIALVLDQFQRAGQTERTADEAWQRIVDQAPEDALHSLIGGLFIASGSALHAWFRGLPDRMKDSPSDLDRIVVDPEVIPPPGPGPRPTEAPRPGPSTGPRPSGQRTGGSNQRRGQQSRQRPSPGSKEDHLRGAAFVASQMYEAQQFVRNASVETLRNIRPKWAAKAATGDPAAQGFLHIIDAKLRGEFIPEPIRPGEAGPSPKSAAKPKQQTQAKAPAGQTAPASMNADQVFTLTPTQILRMSRQELRAALQAIGEHPEGTVPGLAQRLITAIKAKQSQAEPTQDETLDNLVVRAADRGVKVTGTEGEADRARLQAEIDAAPEVQEPWQLTREAYVASRMPERAPTPGPSIAIASREWAIDVSNALARGERPPANVVLEMDSIIGSELRYPDEIVTAYPQLSKVHKGFAGSESLGSTIRQSLPESARTAFDQLPSEIQHSHGIGRVRTASLQEAGESGYRYLQHDDSLLIDPAGKGDLEALQNELIASWAFTHAQSEMQLYRDWRTAAFPQGEIDSAGFAGIDQADAFARSLMRWVQGKASSEVATVFESRFGATSKPQDSTNILAGYSEDAIAAARQDLAGGNNYSKEYADLEERFADLDQEHQERGVNFRETPEGKEIESQLDLMVAEYLRNQSSPTQQNAPNEVTLAKTYAKASTARGVAKRMENTGRSVRVKQTALNEWSIVERVDLKKAPTGVQVEPSKDIAEKPFAKTQLRKLVEENWPGITERIGQVAAQGLGSASERAVEEAERSGTGFDRYIARAFHADKAGQLKREDIGKLVGLPVSEMREGDTFEMDGDDVLVVAANDSTVTLEIADAEQVVPVGPGEDLRVPGQIHRFEVERDKIVPGNTGSFRRGEVSGVKSDLFGKPFVDPLTGQQSDLMFTEPSKLEQETASLGQQPDVEGQETFGFSARAAARYPGARPGFVMIPNTQFIRDIAEEGAKGFRNLFVYDIVDRLRVQNIPSGNTIAELARRSMQDSKAISGELSPALNTVLQGASGRSLASQKAAIEAQKVDWVKAPKVTYGVARIYAAIEGRIRLSGQTRRTLPSGAVVTTGNPGAQELLIEPFQKLIDHTGRIFSREGMQMFNHATGSWDPFSLHYIPGGKVAPRLMSSTGIGIMLQGEGPAWNAWIDAMAHANSMPRADVEAIFRAKHNDMVGSEARATLNRINAEFAREFKHAPTHVKVDNVTVQLLETFPFAYARRIADNAADRIGFVRHFGQQTGTGPSVLSHLRDQYVQQGGNISRLIDVVRALNSMPVETPYIESSNLSLAVREAANVLDGIFRTGLYSLAGIPNLAEFAGNIQAFANVRDLWNALADLRHPGAYLQGLELLGAIDQNIASLAINPDRPLEWFPRVIKELGHRISLAKYLNEAQERFAPLVAQEMVRRMATGGGDNGDVVTLMAMMGWDVRRARRVTFGSGSPEEYLSIIRRAPAFLVGAKMKPGERARAAHNRFYRASFLALTYAEAKIRSMFSLGVATAEAFKARDPGLVYAVSWRWARFLAGSTAAGALQAFIYSLITGGVPGMTIQWNEAKKHPWKFFRDSLIFNVLAGPFGAIIRQATTNSSLPFGERVLRMTLPGFIISESIGAFTGTGQYGSFDATGRAGLFFERFFPINRAAGTAMALFGLGTESHETETAIRAYWRWMFENKPPQTRSTAAIDEDRQRFKVSMRGAYTAMLDQRDPTDKIVEALGVNGSDESALAASLRQRRLLNKLTQEQREDLRDTIGVDAYDLLEKHDAILDGWADTFTEDNRSSRSRPSRRRASSVGVGY